MGFLFNIEIYIESFLGKFFAAAANVRLHGQWHCFCWDMCIFIFPCDYKFLCPVRSRALVSRWNFYLNFVSKIKKVFVKITYYTSECARFIVGPGWRTAVFNKCISPLWEGVCVWEHIPYTYTFRTNIDEIFKCKCKFIYYTHRRSCWTCII